MTNAIHTLKSWAHKLKQELKAVFIAAKDSRTPRIAKILAIAITAYALSPIDLIPDFIPVLGYLDDLIIVPAGIVLVVKLIPTDLMTIYRNAAETSAKTNKNWVAAAIVILTWIALTIVIYSSLIT